MSTVAPEPGAADHIRMPVYCPRCGADRAVLLGAEYGCGRCGAAWPAEDPPLPRPRLGQPEQNETDDRPDQREIGRTVRAGGEYA
jgi:hypothetical protein